DAGYLEAIVQYPLIYLQMTQCAPHHPRMSHVCGRKDWVDYLDVTEVQIPPVDSLHDLVIDVSLAELGSYVRASVSRSSEVDNISLHLADLPLHLPRVNGRAHAVHSRDVPFCFFSTFPAWR